MLSLDLGRQLQARRNDIELFVFAAYLVFVILRLIHDTSF